MLENYIWLLPGFSLIGFLYGAFVLVAKYRRDFKGENDTTQNRAVLIYEIMTTAFLTIGIGLSLTFGSYHYLTNERIITEIIRVSSDLEKANMDIEAKDREIDGYRKLLDIDNPEFSSDWIVRAADRIVGLSRDPQVTTDAAQEIIREEFSSGR